MDNNGRPAYPDVKYKKWLDDMAPFLKNGTSLNRSIELAGLTHQKDSIYRKVKLGDWFCEKVTAFQNYLGELINEAFFQTIFEIHEKVMRGESMTKQDVKVFKFIALHHRSCIPFFVSRREVAKTSTKDIGAVLDRLERE